MAKKRQNNITPTKEQLVSFINDNPKKVSRREIARAFNLKGDQRIWLKQALRELAEEGKVERGRSRRLGPKTKLPNILVCQMLAELSEEGDPLLEPIDSEIESEPFIVLSDKRSAKMAPGDRALVRLTKLESGHGYSARIIRLLDSRPIEVVGIIYIIRGEPRLTPCNRRDDRTYPIKTTRQDNFKDGDLVVAELSSGPANKKEAKIRQRLGNDSDPHSISLISIHAHGIPHEFPAAVVDEAKRVARIPELGKREDLREIPLVTIDGEDARDYDDAVWAEHTDEGWHLIVAIADVSYYVRPHSPLDHEAFHRGTSVYFPDRVVPMLPEALSNDVCSLIPNKDRAAIAAHLWLDNKGRLKRYRFARALIKSTARLTYTQVQKAIDGKPDDATSHLMDDVIKPLYGAYQLLKKARDFRGTLDLDLPEQKIIFANDGSISEIRKMERLESHMLVEEFMILANVAAAQQLEQKQAPCMYRIHEAPSEEKVALFRETVQGLGISFPKGQAILPKTFQNVLDKAKNTPHHSLVSELALRTQMQARYDPENYGHFGLNLTRYAHFTSPIRRYADIMVHRSLVRYLQLGEGGTSGDEDFSSIAQHISEMDRRADAAEREAKERYITSYLHDHIGVAMAGRIRGVVNFGLFVELDGFGTDGLVPLALIPGDYYTYEEAKHRLIGRKSKKTYTLGDEVTVRIEDVNPIANTITLAIVGKA